MSEKPYKVGEVRVDRDTGQVWELQPSTGEYTAEWVPIDGPKAAAAVEAYQQGVPGAFFTGAGKAALGMATLGFGQAYQEAMADPMVQAQQRQNPGAVLAGDIAANALAFGLPAVGVPGRLRAARVAGKIEQEAAAQAAQRAPQQLVRRPSDMLGRATTMGGTARILEATAEAIPGLNIPGIAQKAVNQRRINESLARAIGVSDESAVLARKGLNEDTFAEALAGFERNYDKVRKAVGEKVDQNAARSILEMADGDGFLTGRIREQLKKGQKMNADQLFGLRSELAAVARSNEGYMVKAKAREYTEAIDDIITKALEATGDDGLMKLYSETNQRYRVWASVREGVGLSADGQVNARTVYGRLRRNYGDRVRAGAQVSDIEDVQGFVDIVREGAKLDVGLPSSGTAERAVGAAILGGIASSQL